MREREKQLEQPRVFLNLIHALGPFKSYTLFRSQQEVQILMSISSYYSDLQ